MQPAFATTIDKPKMRSKRVESNFRFRGFTAAERLPVREARILPERIGTPCKTIMGRRVRRYS